MANSTNFTIPIVFLAVFIVAIIYATIWGRKRQRELAELAGRFGFDFRPDKDFVAGERWRFLCCPDEGKDNYGYNILSGECDGYPVWAFDYYFQTGSGKNASSAFYTVFVTTLPCALPDLSIRPEGVVTRLALGSGDIDFESAEFSKSFDVRSPDKRFAYDVCNPRMMEYLLESKIQLIEMKEDWVSRHCYSIEIRQNALALIFYNSLATREFPVQLARLVQIRLRLPEYLFIKS